MNNKHAIHKQLTTHYSLLTNFAFTLAETLIVMGIIGVVAALTLPNLNSSTGDKEKVVKVKKIYQNLNDAMGRAVAVYGPYDEWFVNDANATAQITRTGERLTEFIKVSKNCKMTKGCYTSGNGNNSYYEFILADGTAVSTNTSYIHIDIDGLNKGKNSDRYDRFGFLLDNNGVNIYPMDNATFHVCHQHDVDVPAASWIINYENMDYLKADYNGKCPNGTVLTYPTITSCN